MERKRAILAFRITVCNYSVEPIIQNHNRVLDPVVSTRLLLVLSRYQVAFFTSLVLIHLLCDVFRVAVVEEEWAPPRSRKPPLVRPCFVSQPSPQPHTSPPAVRAGFQSTPCSWASKTSSCSLQTFQADHQSVERSGQERNHMCLVRPRLPGTKPQVL